MKAFGGFFLFAVMAFVAFSFSLTNAGAVCFDISTNGMNITHVFVASTPASSASEYQITVDGDLVEKLYTDDSPCEDAPMDVWFPLQGDQDEAHVCVSIQGGAPDIQLSAKVDSVCVTSSTLDVSIEPVE
jgi:hypothetical protein